MMAQVQRLKEHALERILGRIRAKHRKSTHARTRLGGADTTNSTYILLTDRNYFEIHKKITKFNFSLVIFPNENDGILSY